MAIDFKALGAKAAAEGKDMTKAVQGGGGDYEPPAAGPARLRLISYIELGKQKGTFQGKPVVKDKVRLVFELSGPKHPAKVLDDGTKLPHRITIEENLSLNEKANFFKLFTRMNYAGGATHMAQLVGDAYLGTVYHRTYKGRDGKDRIAAGLNNKADGYSIRPPRFEDPETGELRVVNVDPPISQLRCFLWDYADKEQWDSLFIDGEYPERKDDKGVVTAKAKSKNVLQHDVLRAVNFEGSPLHALLAAGGGTIDIPDAEDGADAEPESADGSLAGATAPATPAKPASEAADPLAGVV